MTLRNNKNCDPQHKWHSASSKLSWELVFWMSLIMSAIILNVDKVNVVILSSAECDYAKWHYTQCKCAECCYAKCHYDDCRGALQINSWDDWDEQQKIVSTHFFTNKDQLRINRQKTFKKWPTCLCCLCKRNEFLSKINWIYFRRLFCTTQGYNNYL